MNFLRKILLSLLGDEKYLYLLSSGFQFLYRRVGLGPDYQDVYFLKKFIGAGDVAVDIGAHLGYFTMELSRLTGDSGRVIAVEPVSRFFRVLQQQVWKRNLHNVELLQVAMGGSEDYVDMGIPKLNAVKKFAYARIKRSNTTLDYVDTERVKNESGDRLFLQLPRLDFIKCDVEGLEVPVFGSLGATLARHRPILLCELADKNERRKLWDMLRPLDYTMYILDRRMLTLLGPDDERSGISHNHYFIPAARAARMAALIRS